MAISAALARNCLLRLKKLGGKEGKRGIVQMEKPPLPGSTEAVHHCCAVGSADDGRKNVNTNKLSFSSATGVAETQKESLVATCVFTFCAVSPPRLSHLS